MNFWVAEIVCVLLQFILFIPFFLKWKKDCKEIGKDNLAVSLKERFIAWIICCPLWLVPILEVAETV